MPASPRPSTRPNGGVYIVSAARTPIGRFLGGLADVPATTLGSIAIRAAVERSGVPADALDEVLMGQVLQAGSGQAPARLAALGAGLPSGVGATTINRVCGSGLKAIMLAAASIRAGDAEVLVAGGMESMSRAPYLLPRGRQGYRLGHGEVLDAAVLDGLWCATDDCHMGTHAERVAAHAGVPREEQDAFALESHHRAVAAMDGGRFADELVGVETPGQRGRPGVLLAEDELPRRDTSPEALAGLAPVFDVPADAESDPGHPSGHAPERAPRTVTAGNSPGLADGAAATVVASERAVERHGLTPLARIVAYAQADVEPRWLFLAPVAGIRRLLERSGLDLAAFDLVELNEAFAAQVLADARELGLDRERLNVNGGAIALGHPIGASGARIVVTLLHELRRREGRYGMAALCLGGGGAVAMAFERVA